MYQALYRKYRPRDFDSVVGQDAIIKTLKNSIIHHTFSHAYMFFGPRGTGKTTVSKIFARNVNCLDSINGNACQKCDNCLYSFSKECVDIIEIDAASNNGVDEIRELRNKISLVPSQLKFKVYIIDEVHMLSIGAFNALLKTLEEPPEHAIFILATTDPQKVPETIISRCQCFSFKKISNNVICQRLRYVCDCENISIDDDVLKNIAIFSDGGMRDALGLLDKLTSYCDDNKITLNDFNDINGIVSDNEILEFLHYILNSDISHVLKSIEKYDTDGKNLFQILLQLLNFSRNLVVDYYLNSSSFDFSIDNVIDFINLLNENMFDIKKSDNIQIYIEMLLLKFMNQLKSNNSVIDNNSSYNEKDVDKEYIKVIDNSSVNNNNDNNNNNNNNLANLNNSNSQLSSNISLNSNSNFSSISKSVDSSIDSHLDNDNSIDNVSQKILNLDEIISIRINNTLALADKNLLKLERSNFDKLKDFTFDQDIGFLVCNLLDANLRVVSPDSIIISYEYDSTVEQNLNNLDKLTEIYNRITNSNKKIAIVSDSRWDDLKNDYIYHIKNHINYDVKDEPKVILEDFKKDDIITSSAIDLFGDIVEFE